MSNSIVFKDSKELAKINFGGYKKHIKLGLSMGKKAIEKNLDYRILLFGCPGTGKSAYPKAIAGLLSEYGYSYLTVKCNSLIEEGNFRQFERYLSEVKKYLQKTPIIVVLDEIDTLAQRRDKGERDIYTTATSKIMHLLDRKIKPGLIYGTINNLHELDTAVRSRFSYPIFFDFDPDAMLSILKENEIPNADKVQKHLIEFEKRELINFSSRGISKACKIVEKTNNSEEMSKRLCINSGIPLPNSEKTDYERVNREFINFSNEILNHFE